MNRISAGIVFGSLLLAGFFAVWTLLKDDGGGPVIGVLVFQVIGLAFSIFLGVRLIRETNKEDEKSDVIIV